LYQEIAFRSQGGRAAWNHHNDDPGTLPGFRPTRLAKPDIHLEGFSNRPVGPREPFPKLRRGESFKLHGDFKFPYWLVGVTGTIAGSGVKRTFQEVNRVIWLAKKLDLVT
jgi:hypothetical protein